MQIVYLIIRLPLSLSILAHLICLVFLTAIGRHFIVPADYSNKTTPIQLEQINRDQFEQLKRLGIKNGAKHFSMKTPEAEPPVGSTISKLSLEALKREIQKSSTINPVNEYEAPTDSKDTFSELSLIRKMEKKSIPATKIITDHKLANLNPEAYQRASFNIDFIPPEGVNEDELNSMEKMFYSFQKRTYLTYLNSFIKNYEELAKKRPMLESAVQNENHVLTGKIIYDKEGHIVAIKILKWSVNDHIQELFDETLKDLNLPNPPVALIKEKEFTIYFQLVFNDRRY